MPLDPAGNFSLVPSYFAEPGSTIKTEQHNPTLEDIANVMSMHLVRDGRNGMVAPLNMGSFPVTNVGPGVNPTDAATIAQVTGAGPIGVVVDFAGETAPIGWMLCYGQAVSRTTYAALFSVIGSTYGAGDGSTTFNLPDCRGRVTAGKDDMGGTDAKRLSDFIGALARTLGGVFGAASHVLTTGQMPKHGHSASISSGGAHTHPAKAYNGGVATNNDGLPLPVHGSGAPSTTTNNAISSAGSHSHAATIGDSGGDQAHNNVQPSIVFNKIIRVSI